MTDEADWREFVRNLPQFVPDLELDPPTCALVVIDMQNFGLRRDSGLGRILAQRYPALAEYFFPRLDLIVIPNIRRLLSFFRANALRIVYVTVGPELPDASDYFPRRRRRDDMRLAGDHTLFPRGTKEHEIIDELVPQRGELVLNKTSMSPFNSTGIDQLLRNMGVHELLITGVGTHACVETTARDAADRGYDVCLIEDACASLHPQLHQATLISFALLSGQVMATADAMEALQRKLVSGSGRTR
jgi:nicotinamidase-related amidase